MTAPAKTHSALEALIEAHARRAASSRPSAAGSERWPPKPSASSRPRSPTSPRCWRPRSPNAPSAARRRRLIDARFPLVKRLEDFRFADNPKVPQATIAALAEGSWIDDREVVILIGESGTGKTMLATALAVCACQQGRRVRFTTLAGLATELQEADSRRELARVVGRYARTELVVLDELGYLTLPEGAAELVFQVISERNERGSLIVTTNLPFGEWTKVFPDPRLAKAVVDRHHPQGAHHRHRHRVLALPPRPRTQDANEHDPQPNGAPAAIAAPPRAYGLGLRDDSRGITTPGDQATSTPTTTDAKWGHFKRPRWGHCKRPLRWLGASPHVGALRGGHAGVCLIFDRDRLDAAFQAELGGRGRLTAGNVTYSETETRR